MLAVVVEVRDDEEAGERGVPVRVPVPRRDAAVRDLAQGTRPRGLAIANML